MLDNNNEKYKEVLGDLQNEEIGNKEIIDKALEIAQNVLDRKEEKEENEETLQEKNETMTAKKAMEYELEELDEIGLGRSILDDKRLKIKDILETHQNREKLVELVYTLPHQTRCWAVQRLDIYDRLSKTNFLDWYNSKKELTYDDYIKLERELNRNKDGISLPQLATITGKEEDYLFKELRAGCGLSVVNILPYEFVMEDYLYIRLIPLVNENNQLEEEIGTQYLLKGNALYLLAEYWGYDYSADICC